MLQLDELKLPRLILAVVILVMGYHVLTSLANLEGDRSEPQGGLFTALIAIMDRSLLTGRHNFYRRGNILVGLLLYVFVIGPTTHLLVEPALLTYGDAIRNLLPLSRYLFPIWLLYNSAYWAIFTLVEHWYILAIMGVYILTTNTITTTRDPYDYDTERYIPEYFPEPYESEWADSFVGRLAPRAYRLLGYLRSRHRYLGQYLETYGRYPRFGQLEREYRTELLPVTLGGDMIFTTLRYLLLAVVTNPAAQFLIFVQLVFGTWPPLGSAVPDTLANSRVVFEHLLTYFNLYACVLAIAIISRVLSSNSELKVEFDRFTKEIRFQMMVLLQVALAAILYFRVTLAPTPTIISDLTIVPLIPIIALGVITIFLLAITLAPSVSNYSFPVFDLNPYRTTAGLVGIWVFYGTICASFFHVLFGSSTIVPMGTPAGEFIRGIITCLAIGMMARTFISSTNSLASKFLVGGLGVLFIGQLFYTLGAGFAIPSLGVEVSPIVILIITGLGLYAPPAISSLSEALCRPSPRFRLFTMNRSLGSTFYKKVSVYCAAILETSRVMLNCLSILLLLSCTLSYIIWPAITFLIPGLMGTDLISIVAGDHVRALFLQATGGLFQGGDSVTNTVGEVLFRTIGHLGYTGDLERGGVSNLLGIIFTQMVYLWLLYSLGFRITTNPGSRDAAIGINRPSSPEVPGRNPEGYFANLILQHSCYVQLIMVINLALISLGLLFPSLLSLLVNLDVLYPTCALAAMTSMTTISWVNPFSYLVSITSLSHQSHLFAIYLGDFTTMFKLHIVAPLALCNRVLALL